MQPFEQLEHEFEEWTGNPNTVACSSGTSALHLALEALELPYGEVIVPEFTMIACARAVTMAGLQPVFVDCTDSLLMDLELLHAAVNRDTVAVMPVHIYGRRCNMDEITRLSHKHRFAVIEDLAEAHGVMPHADSAAACWSFYSNKIIAGEEGGMVAFRKQEHADKARQLRSLGFTSSHNFLHVPRGVNARMSDANAGLILKSLRNVKQNLAKRAQVEELYNQQIPRRWQMPERDVCWVYDVRLRGIDASDVVQKLNQMGFAARLGFKPMSMQPEYRGPYKHLEAYKASKEVLYLPVKPAMPKDIDAQHTHAVQMCSNLRRIVRLQGRPHLLPVTSTK